MAKKKDGYQRTGRGEAQEFAKLAKGEAKELSKATWKEGKEFAAAATHVIGAIFGVGTKSQKKR